MTEEKPGIDAPAGESVAAGESRTPGDSRTAGESEAVGNGGAAGGSRAAGESRAAGDEGAAGAKPTGRAPVRRPPRGRARIGQAVGKTRLPEHAVTGIVEHDISSTQPVFVDPSGARHRRMRAVAYAAGVLLILVLAAVWVSQLVGPAAPPPRPTPSVSVAR